MPTHDADGNKIDYVEVFSADPGALWKLPESPSDLLDRRARVRLGHQNLLDMLRLPPGTQIKAIQTSFDPSGIDIVIVNPDLPVVDRDSESPIYGGAVCTVHSFNADDGHVYTRSTVDWPLPTGGD